eukprot:SAG31_NODE_3913_length_3756_cov_1.959256_2_plen_84_part_00
MARVFVSVAVRIGAATCDIFCRATYGRHPLELLSARLPCLHIDLGLAFLFTDSSQQWLNTHRRMPNVHCQHFGWRVHGISGSA